MPIVEKGHILGALALFSVQQKESLAERKAILNGHAITMYDFDIERARKGLNASEIDRVFETESEVYVDGKLYLCLKNPELAIVENAGVDKETIDEKIFLHGKHIADRKGKVYGEVRTSLVSQ